MVQSITTGFICHSCGKNAFYLGQLPAVRVHAAVNVFKCETCMTILSTPAGLDEPAAASPDGWASFG